MSGAGVLREMVAVFDVQLNVWQVLVLVVVVVLLLAGADRLRELMSGCAVADAEAASPDVCEPATVVEGVSADPGEEALAAVPAHDLLVAVAKVYVLREFIGSGLSGGELVAHKAATVQLMRGAPGILAFGPEVANAGCALLVDISSQFFALGRTDFDEFVREWEEDVVGAYRLELAMHSVGGSDVVR